MMTHGTTPAGERLAAYRSKHFIDLDEQKHPEFGRIYRCKVDGLRIHATRNGRWYHDPSELKDLLDAEYGGPWGGPKTVVVESNDAFVVTVDDDEDDDEDDQDEHWDNREGQPEFNGAFG